MVAEWTEEDRQAVTARVRSLADLPGVQSEESSGHVGWSVAGRRFAWLQVDHHGDGRLAVVVKAPPGEQQALVGSAPCYFVPAYLGARGWVGVDLAPDRGADWAEVAALLDQAWRATAPKRLLAQRES